jgi:cytochrome c-type biogenesis protein CcsB
MNAASLSDVLVAAAIAAYAAAFIISAADLARNRVAAWTGASAAVRTPAASARSAPVELDDGVEANPGGTGRAADATSEPGRLTGGAVALLAVGCALNVGAVITRGIAAERAPWGNMYEFALVGAASIAVAFLIARRRFAIDRLNIGVAGLALLVLGLAVTVLYVRVDALIPVLNSYWLAIHVAAAIVAGGAFTIAAIASVAFLFRRWRERRRGETPDPTGMTAVLERASYGLVVFAFPIWTFAVMAGAVWAEAAWGRYWGWDPKETWAFITWVLYAAYLHAQATAGWRGGRAAWFSVFGYAAFLFNFVGVNIWIPGLHSYAGV